MSPAEEDIMAAAQAPLIAVIDPDPTLLRLLNETLMMDGFRTLLLTAGDGSAGTIAEEKPDLVVMDTWIEDREAGWELYRALRQGNGTSKIPLVICSSDPDEMKARSEILRANGMVSILDKPFDPDILVERIRFMLDQHG